jgi:hypothetical protein
MIFCMATAHSTARTALGNCATIVLGDERQDHRLVRFEIAHRLFLVAPHEARVAGDVRGEDRREATLVCMEGYRLLGHGFSMWTRGLLRGQPGALRQRLLLRYSQRFRGLLNRGEYLLAQYICYT